MGSRTEFSDAGGNFSFHSLPPGVYAIDVELEGFLPQRRSEVEVRLHRVTEIHISPARLRPRIRRVLVLPVRLYAVDLGNSYGAAYQEPRGSAEANENHRLDLQAAKGFRVGKNNRFELIASIYNVLDDEQAIRVCTRSRGCWRDIEVGDPTRYREPRRFEAGVRFEF